MARVGLATAARLAGSNCTPENAGEMWEQRMDAIGRRLQMGIEHEVVYPHALDEEGQL